MREWLVHPKVFDHSTDTFTKKKFKKIESEKVSINQQKQFFENKNATPSIMAIEANKIDDHQLFKVQKKPIFHFFHNTNPMPALRSTYKTKLKLQFQNEQSIRKLNSLLKEPHMKHYVAHQKKDKLEVTFSGGLENALIVLSVINKEFQDSKFSLAMREALTALFFHNAESKEALVFKHCLENFTKFNPNDLDEKPCKSMLQRTRIYWPNS